MRLPGAWRTIEVGIRAGWTWPFAFEAFRGSPHVSDEALWMLACAMREHAVYLLYCPTARNFKTMETNGLAHAAMMFPEFVDSYAFASTAVDRAIAELEREFYPDGCQEELAPSYALVCISNLFAALKMAEWRLDRTGTCAHWNRHGMAVPPHTWDRFEALVNALGKTAMPDGVCPPLHDSEPRGLDSVRATLRERMGRTRFRGRPWRRKGASLLEWGGYAVTRGRGAWSLFDAGPYGTAHQHHDALQFLAWADGHDCCVDGGKPLYDESDISKLIRSAAGHNVVLMDRRPHLQDPSLMRAPAPLPVACVRKGDVFVRGARRRFRMEDRLSAGFDWERVIVDLPSKGWLLLDRLWPADEAAHAWEWLWHMPAGRLDAADAGVLASRPGGAATAVTAAGSAPFVASAAAGQTAPVMRGWQVDDDQRNAPLPVAILLTEPVRGRVTMVTLVCPLRGDCPPLPAPPSLGAVTDDEVRATLEQEGVAYEVVWRGGRTVSEVSLASGNGVATVLRLPSHEFPANGGSSSSR
jgi:hypothetical protein